MPRPIAVDLFSGAGGLSLGLEQAGFDVVASVEYDPVHAATHEFNFPKTKMLCADVSALGVDTLREAIRAGLGAHGRDPDDWDGEIDAVVGGPPCQGFSLIGKRLIDDKRNRLVFHFYRLVSALRPRYFVIENVPGMATGGHASILEKLIAEFEESGYRFPKDGNMRHKVLNAADYGVPQERHRLFLIGSRKDRPLAAYPTPRVHPVSKRSSQPSPRRDTTLPRGPSVLEAIGDLPNPTHASLYDSDTALLSSRAVAKIERTASAYARRLRDLDMDATDLSYRRIWNRALLTSSMRTEHTDKSRRRFRKTAHGKTEPNSRFYKLDPEGLCNTLRAGSGSERGAFTSPRPIHPSRGRVLSNREAARLHSFPDWFRLHATKWHGFRQIGNAVAPLVGRAVGSQIVMALGVSPVKPTEPIALGGDSLLWLSMSQAAARYGVDKGSIPAPRTRTERIVDDVGVRKNSKTGELAEAA